MKIELVKEQIEASTMRTRPTRQKSGLGVAKIWHSMSSIRPLLRPLQAFNSLRLYRPAKRLLMRAIDRGSVSRILPLIGWASNSRSLQSKAKLLLSHSRQGSRKSKSMQTLFHWSAAAGTALHSANLKRAMMIARASNTGAESIRLIARLLHCLFLPRLELADTPLIGSTASV